jgi:uncharacterized protein
VTPRSRAAVGTAAILAAAVVALPLGPAHAASGDVVVSEVYGGGGNAGATLTNDFVELFNPGISAVDVSGWSVQYASATGTTWQVTKLSGAVPAGGHYLVQEAKGGGGTAALPDPDATGGISMSATHGRVALVDNAVALTCGGACASAADVVDFVGFGSDVTDHEGSGPAPDPSNTTSDSRDASGTDADDNAADFTAGDPSPTNSAGETGAGGGQSGCPGTDTTAGDVQIHDIQGAAQTSPYDNQDVSDVPGVVTAVGDSDFWMQSTSPDGDPATSEGVDVYAGGTPCVSVGDSVLVSGHVYEYRPGGTSSANLTTTEIEDPVVSLLSSGNDLPAPTLVGRGGRVPPGAVIENDADGTVEDQASFDPAGDGIDFWESMEGMRVGIRDAQVVGPTSSFDETPVVPDGSSVRTPRGGIVLRASDPNPERVVLDETLGSVPAANVGDSYTGTTVGILGYDFADFHLMVTDTPTLVPGGTTREVTSGDHGSQLSIASFNVENLDPTDPQTKFDGLAEEIVHNLAAPDVVALEEVQDNDGATDDGVVAADQTLSTLVDAIEAAGGPTYDWRQVDPVNDQEGGEPGGNIRNVLLFQPGKSLRFVDRGTPSSTEATMVAGRGERVHLTRSPGRIDPTSPAWDDSRVPLVGQLTWRGHPLFVITNHFRSKGGDDPLFGRFQPPQRSSEPQRHQQAMEVRGFVDDLLAANPDARVVVTGDLNDFQFSQTADILVGSGRTRLTDLPRTLPVPEQYTYDYEGNSQVLDHILLSPSLTHSRFRYDIVHVNSEFADQLSDHDPQVVTLLGGHGPG